MGTAAKIIGVETGDMAKVIGVTTANAAKIANQTIESFSNTKCLDFDGSDDYLNIPYHSSLDLYGSEDTFSISFWIKFNDIANSGWKSICGHGKHSTNKGWSLDMYGSNPPTQINFHKPSGGTWVNVNIEDGGDVAGGALVNDTWYHFVVRWDQDLGGNGQAAVFIDGADTIGLADMDMAALATEEPLIIGAGPHTCSAGGWHDCIASYINARIDEFSFWNKYLSNADIAAIYNSGVPTDLSTHASASNLVSWYRMGDAVSGSTIPDQKGSNDGTMTNMVSGDVVTDNPTA